MTPEPPSRAGMSAVLYALDVHRVAAFYAAVCALSVRDGDAVQPVAAEPQHDREQDGL